MYSTTQEEPGPMHYTRITLFIVFLCGVGPQMSLWREERLQEVHIKGGLWRVRFTRGLRTFDAQVRKMPQNSEFVNASDE